MQKHSNVLSYTVEQLADEASYKPLFHSGRDDEAMPSGAVLNKIVELCRAILFPGYYGNERINKQTIRFHIGVNVETLYARLTQQVYAGICFSDETCAELSESQIRTKAEQLSEVFIAKLPELRNLLTSDVEATYKNDPAARNKGEVIFCYPGIRAISNYRIAHQLYKLGVPFIPRMITEMAHSETGIDIHPGAEIGTHFSIDHGTGIVIGETSIIGNNVRLFQGVSLAGKKTLSDDYSHFVENARRHPLLEDNVTIYSNSTLLGPIRVGKRAVIFGNVWLAEDVAEGAMVKQNKA